MSIVLPRLQGISPAQFSHVLEALRQQAAALAMGQPFSIPDTNKALTDALSNSGLPSTPLLLSNLASCIDVMRILDQLRHTYWYYNGPIKVPGFDAFVLTHEVLKAAVQANGGYERLVEAQSKYGNQFGNLLQLGGLAFAPDTVEVSRLVQHMNSTYQVRRARLLPAASVVLYISILSAHSFVSMGQGEPAYLGGACGEASKPDLPPPCSRFVWTASLFSGGGVPFLSLFLFLMSNLRSKNGALASSSNSWDAARQFAQLNETVRSQDKFYYILIFSAQLNSTVNSQDKFYYILIWCTFPSRWILVWACFSCQGRPRHNRRQANG